MKKWIALLLALMMCFALCACGGSSEKEEEPEEEAEEQTAEKADEAEEDAADSAFYGTWEVVAMSAPSGDFKVADMEKSNSFTTSDWRIVISETGKLYLQTHNNSVVNDCTLTESSVTSGANVWNYENDQLVLTSGNSSFYYEKVSDSQEFPDPQKADLIAMLVGTWELQSDAGSGTFVFTDKSCTATIDGAQMELTSLSVLMDRNQIKLSATGGGNIVTLTLDYTVEGDSLSLVYSGNALVKQ